MNELNPTLLSQLFSYSEADNRLLAQCREQAAAIAALQQCIVVISDFRYNHSYIYAGAFGSQFALTSQDATSPAEIIDTGSAFEDCLFSKFHPDDEKARKQLEWNYLRFMQTVPIACRSHYNTSITIRIQNSAGQYRNVQYSVHYRASQPNGSVWLAVCFYAPTAAHISPCILNNQTGEIVLQPSSKQYAHIRLTQRETQILRLISNGMASKQIADLLCISEHTVNRHRQNIIERLGVSNTTQALHAAHLIGLI